MQQRIKTKIISVKINSFMYSHAIFQRFGNKLRIWQKQKNILSYLSCQGISWWHCFLLGLQGTQQLVMTANWDQDEYGASKEELQIIVYKEGAILYNCGNAIKRTNNEMFNCSYQYYIRKPTRLFHLVCTKWGTKEVMT